MDPKCIPVWCLFLWFSTPLLTSSPSLPWPPFYPFTGWLGHKDALIKVHSRRHHNAPCKTEWHSIAMEKPSRLCDWLLVNKEVNAVWGLWGEGAKQNNNDWIREVASKERDRKKKREKRRMRTGQSTSLLIAPNQKDLLISNRKLFNPLWHIKLLDFHHIYCICKCVCITKAPHQAVPQ